MISYKRASIRKKEKKVEVDKDKDKKYKNNPNPNPKSYIIKSSDAKVKHRQWVDKERTIILSNEPTCSSIIDQITLYILVYKKKKIKTIEALSLVRKKQKK